MLNPIKLASKNFLTSLDISAKECNHIIELAKNLKNNKINFEYKNKVLGLVFDKSCLLYTSDAADE